MQQKLEKKEPSPHDNKNTSYTEQWKIIKNCKGKDKATCNRWAFSGDCKNQKELGKCAAVSKKQQTPAHTTILSKILNHCIWKK